MSSPVNPREAGNQAIQEGGIHQPSKRARFAPLDKDIGSSVLPAPVWANVLSYLPFDEMKECAALNRAFLGEISPRVISLLRPDFTLRIKVPESEEHEWEPSPGLLTRFRGVQGLAIEKFSYHYMIKPRALRRILTSLGSDLSSLSVATPPVTYRERGDVPGAADLPDPFRTLHDLRETFSPVCTTLRELKIKTYLYPQLMMHAITTLKALVRLELTFTVQMFDCHKEMRPRGSPATVDDDGNAFGKTVEVLESLPNLRELKLDYSRENQLGGLITEYEIVAGFMLGCSRLKNLRVLESDYFLFAWNERCEDAFATMLCGLLQLEILSTLMLPEATLWSKVASRGGGARLKTLALGYDEVYEKEDLIQLVHIILRQFPLLACVEMQLSNHYLSLEETLRILSRLREHPRLRIIKFDIHGNSHGIDWASGKARLQELVGSRIEVQSYDRDSSSDDEY